MLLSLFLSVLTGYLLGSFPSGYVVGKCRGIDIRQHGSGNIGATNVARVLGVVPGMIVLVLDAAKGALPVAAALRCSGDLRVAIATGAVDEVLPLKEIAGNLLAHISESGAHRIRI